MIRTLVALVALAVCFAARPVHAQAYVPPQASPYGTGGISPFVNMLRPGNPAVNYYGLVQPQIQANQQFGQLQQQTQQLARGQASLVAPPTNQAQTPTGHATGFMQHGHYFMTTGIGRQGNNQTAAALGQQGNPPAATFGQR
jgi:hypothetical protein